MLVRSNYFILILVILCSIQTFAYGNQQDPYSVLGISRSASTKEIKQAYKRLVMEWHPDKNDSPEAKEKIMDINRAYEVNFKFNLIKSFYFLGIIG